MITILLVSLFAVSTVSAADNVTGNITGVEGDISENSEIIGVEADIDGVLSFERNDALTDESVNVTVIPVNCDADYSTGNFTFRIADENTGNPIINKNVRLALKDSNGNTAYWILKDKTTVTINQTIELGSDDNGIVTVKNSNFYPGFTFADYIFAPPGNYTLKVSDSKNGIVYGEIPLTVHNLNANSSLDFFKNVNVTVNHETALTVYVNSTLTVYEGTVTFFEGEDKIGETDVAAGVASIAYTPKSAGKHTINAFFNSQNYGCSNATLLLNVSKLRVDLNLHHAFIQFNETVYYKIILDSIADGGEIELYADDVLIGTSPVKDGVAGFYLTPNSTGEFLLNAVYSGNENIFGCNGSGSLTIYPMATTLTAESIIFDYKSNKTFTVELKDDYGKGIGGQSVKIEVGDYLGKSLIFTGISDADGIVVYDVGNLTGGKWYVSGIYSGNANYFESGFFAKFILIIRDTETDLEPIADSKVNHSCKIKASVRDENGKSVNEGIVRIYIDGVEMESINLSDNSQHQLNYIPTNAGKHNLTAVYEPTVLYKSSNSTTSFEVSDSNTTETIITAGDITAVYNADGYLLIKLSDVFANKISGVKLNVVINGRTLTPTVTNGQVKVSTNGLAPLKTYSVKITFAGNSKYDKSAKTAKVTVKKATPKLTAKAKTLKRSDKTKKYTVTLKTNQNKAMKNTKVTITVNKKTYTSKTNSKGVATFKLTKLTKKGKYTAAVKYSGSKYYNAVTVKAKITLK